MGRSRKRKRGLRDSFVPPLRERRGRGFTLVEILVVIAIISICAGFLLPTIRHGQEEGIKIDCQNKLRQIGTLATIYASSGKRRFFPFGQDTNPPAHMSLNELVRATSHLDPDLFVCRAWRGDAATRDEHGYFELDELSNSYAYSGVRLSPIHVAALASDKSVRSEAELVGHRDGMNVVYTDGHVEFVSIEELDPRTGLPANLVR